MSPAFEAFLAKIYVDAKARKRFLENPVEEARLAGLSVTESKALSAIDRDGLEFAAASFEQKRRSRVQRIPWLRHRRRLRANSPWQ